MQGTWDVMKEYAGDTQGSTHVTYSKLLAVWDKGWAEARLCMSQSELPRSVGPKRVELVCGSDRRRMLTAGSNRHHPFVGQIFKQEGGVACDILPVTCMHALQ